MNNTLLLQQFDLLATAPGGVAQLRELILTLAVQGKLVPQDPADEPASALLKRIRAEKDRLMAEGKIKRDKTLAAIEDDEKPFGLPSGWEWVKLGDICTYIQRGKGPVYTENSAHRVVSQKCVRWYGLDLAAARFITPESLVKYEAIRFLQAGDLLWNSTGTGTIGRACLVPPEYSSSGLVADSHVTVVRPVQVNSWFLWRWIQCPYVQSAIEGFASGTTNQIELNTSTVVNHLIPLPPLPEQARIVARVEELMRVCDELEATGQRQAAHHRQLVQTLLGQLTAAPDDSAPPNPPDATPPTPAPNHPAQPHPTSPPPAATPNPWQRVAAHFDTLLDRPSAVDALEQTILQLAVRGQLVPPDATDEPASALLQRIRAEKDRLIAAGKIKRDKPLAPMGEDEQPFELPKGWEWVRLGLLTSLITSGSRSWKDFYSADGATFIRSQDIKFDRLEFDDRAFVKLPPRTEGVRTQVQLQDLLITITGANVGKAAIVSMSITEAYVSQHVALVRLHNVNLADFLHLWLVSEHEGRKLLLTSSYGAKPGLNLHNINELFVPLPPLPEQARIVARVAQLRRLCAELRQRLAQSQTTQGRLAQACVENAVASSLITED
jgi:type I restriction enzyme, S subunit